MSDDLEERVAGLEGLVRQIAGQMGIPADVPMTDEQAAEFRRLLGEAMQGQKPFTHRVLPSPPPLTPDEVRQILRESVTVVKPGEVLFFSSGDPNMTPNQMRELQGFVNWWLEHNAPDVKALVLPHGEMAAAETPEPGFLKDCRIDTYRAGLPGQVPPAVRITHLPTGVTAEASGDSELSARSEAIRKLATALAARGDIAINEGRRVLGLPEWAIPEFDTAQPMPQA